MFKTNKEGKYKSHSNCLKYGGNVTFCIS